MKKKWIIAGLFIVIAGGGYVALKGMGTGFSSSDFELIQLERGNIVQEVTASGKIQPINTVSVGTQVSGIIESVLVDYNDEVKKDQLLAKLDTKVLIENKKDAEARLQLAKVKQKIQELNYNRFEQLFKDKLIAKASLEEAEILLETAKADVLSAQAEYNKAEQNYEYASIISPVSGTVISKEVEEGQTVAASYQTPTLFTIAEDLSKMQIEASIAEADIGLIKSKMPVTFTVDAYPNDVFNGTVEQIRLSPTEEQNVVMYTVVIEVDNSSRKLLPGMTAFVNIKIDEVKDVIRVPTTALQYKPNAVVRQFIDQKNISVQSTEGVVYQIKGSKIVPIIFKRGLSNTSYVEVLSGLNEGDQIIAEYLGKGARRK